MVPLMARVKSMTTITYLCSESENIFYQTHVEIIENIPKSIAIPKGSNGTSKPISNTRNLNDEQMHDLRMMRILNKKILQTHL